jgi:hypothetical protein
MKFPNGGRRSAAWKNASAGRPVLSQRPKPALSAKLPQACEDDLGRNRRASRFNEIRMSMLFSEIGHADIADIADLILDQSFGSKALDK